MAQHPKRVLIVVGTRPNFIKITQFERVFASYNGYFEYRLLHTGQHYDDNMSKVFFEQLKLKKPDYYLGIDERTPARQIGRIIIELGDIFEEWRPDIVLVPGDVNSTLAAAVATNKYCIKLAHIESGLRSHDREMPEEHNRNVTDVLADAFFVTEPSGVENLLKENKPESSIHMVGNTMIDTLVAFNEQIMQSPVLDNYDVQEGEFVLMTMHRPSNVDGKESLSKLIDIIERVTEDYPIIFPIHPRTTQNIKNYGLEARVQKNNRLKFTEPLDYFAFQKLTASCKFVLTDSGGIQEETTYRQVPCLTLRENTERPVTLTEGTNTLVKFEFEAINSKIQEIIDGTYKKGAIPELWDGKATERIVEVLKEIT